MMKKKNKFLIAFILFSTLFCASGEFDGWGNTILHHVADSEPVALLDINGDGEVDFIVHAGNDEHVLIETKSQKVKAKHVLENAQRNPFGC